MSPKLSRSSFYLAALFCLAAAGCGGSGGKGNGVSGQAISLGTRSLVLHSGEIWQLEAKLGGQPVSGATWAVSPGGGTVSQDGLYTPPAKPGAYLVTVSSPDARSASVAIRVKAPLRFIFNGTTPEQPGVGPNRVMATIDSTGGNFKRLLVGNGVGLPYVSPDGKTVFFSQNSGGQRLIFRMGPDGSGLTALPAVSSNMFYFLLGVDWTAGRLIYTRNNGFDESRPIYSANLRGTDERLVFQDSHLTDLTSNPRDRSWLGDIFTPQGNSGFSDILRVFPASHLTSPFLPRAFRPEVSPNGKMVAFDDDPPGSGDGGIYDIGVANIDGSNRHNLTHTTESELVLDWTPDGRDRLHPLPPRARCPRRRWHPDLGHERGRQPTAAPARHRKQRIR